MSPASFLNIEWWIDGKKDSSIPSSFFSVMGGNGLEGNCNYLEYSYFVLFLTAFRPYTFLDGMILISYSMLHKNVRISN